MPESIRTEAVLVSDIHLCHIPPVARSHEKNWYETQEEYLRQIEFLARRSAKFDLLGDAIPIICAGDIFHKWNPPLELVNWAIDHLPQMYAVPGQHDLPNHNYNEIKKSAYWTLCQSGKIINLQHWMPQVVRNLRLWGFPWGHDLFHMHKEQNTFLWDIAVIHRYIWTDTTGYPDAPEEFKLSATRKQLEGFDVAHFGDNHIPFVATKKDPIIVNPGSFMRRNIDQIDHRPRVYLLKSDKTVVPHYLDCSQDKLISPDDALKGVEIDGKPIRAVLESLKDLGGIALDYEQAVVQYLNRKKVRSPLRELILSYVEEWRTS